METNIVTIGGGTGTFVVLQALKELENVKLTALVTTADDGGIAKKEKDEFGVLPQSDVRKALIALSDEKENKIIRELFMYRFSKGVGIEGATLGNLLLTALTEILGDQFRAIEMAEKMLNIKGRVIPITLDKTNILITLENNQEIFGETSLDNVYWEGTQKIKNIDLVPKAKIFKNASDAVKNANYIFIPPGDLYGSIIVNFRVKGFLEALKRSKAKIIYTCNLVTKYGQTSGFGAKNHLNELEKYLGKKVDIVVLNTESINPKILVEYTKEKSEQVTYNIKELEEYKIYASDLVNDEVEQKQKGDKQNRNLLRHDINALTRIYKKILNEN
ncbi:uridine diphosphate-N-acetylglucosamine-binding protein YvcK [Patescibacteria group bacterium]|nr:uridine diphosphate-N-acetylglucosamine-binding protein YvcK [Patescibacteria group bacterium]